MTFRVSVGEQYNALASLECTARKTHTIFTPDVLLSPYLLNYLLTYVITYLITYLRSYLLT